MHNTPRTSCSSASMKTYCMVYALLAKGFFKGKSGFKKLISSLTHVVPDDRRDGLNNLKLTHLQNPHSVPFAYLAKPSPHLISALGCVEFGDRQAVCVSVMGQHGVCKGGCSSVHKRSRHKCFIQDRKQRSLSLG